MQHNGWVMYNVAQNMDYNSVSIYASFSATHYFLVDLELMDRMYYSAKYARKHVVWVMLNVLRDIVSSLRESDIEVSFLNIKMSLPALASY